MAVRPLVLYPDPALLKPTLPVAEVDDEVRRFVEDMRDTMYAAPGIGLAANQVGDARRICIVDLTAGEQTDSLVVLINPVIVRASGCQLGEEGCLSFPDVTIDVERAMGDRSSWRPRGCCHVPSSTSASISTEGFSCAISPG